MLLYNAHKQKQGFTLVEMLIAIIIVGILATVATPSFISLFSKSKVKDALEQVEGALKEAQRQAMTRSKKCIVTINTSNNKITSSNSCLLSERQLQGITIIPANPQIEFSFKGNTTTDATIILSSNDSSTKRCIVVSNGLGIMKSGIYEGSTSPIVASNCKVSLE